MEKEQAKLLMEVHGTVQRLEGIIKGSNGDGMSHRVSKNTEDLGFVKKNMVTDDKCHTRIKSLQLNQKTQIKSAVVEAMDGKKRSKWILLKDILLGLFSAGGIGTLLLLALMDKL